MKLPSLLVILIRQTFSEGCMQGHPSVASARPCLSISLRRYRQALLSFSPLLHPACGIHIHDPHPGRGATLTRVVNSVGIGVPRSYKTAPT